MNWQARLDNIEFQITTGDGKVYKPLWKNGRTKKDFNAVAYEFIDKDGALVDRKRVKARSFPLVFWFTGATNIDDAEAFDQSANDPRVWLIQHPFYGNIYCQPLSLERNDEGYNATEFMAELLETITTTPAPALDIADVIDGYVADMATISPLDYGSKVNLKPADVTTIKNSLQLLNDRISKLLDASNYSAYTTLKNSVFASVDQVIALPVTALQGIHNLLQLPSQFAVSVSTRISLLAQLYQDVKAIPRTLEAGISDITSLLGIKNNKAYFESVGAAIIVNMSNAMVNPQAGDFVTKKQIVAAEAVLSATFEDYLSELDVSYIAVSDTQNAFSASQPTQNLLQSAVISTLANMNALAFNAKQERIAMVQRDTNLIVLTHQYMGLDAADANIETFRQINGIKNKELFLVKKGRKIIYYV